ncbi:hypothetical protein RhiirC2_789265 [Rhizophagus irregularis]|uniref:Replication origin-binding protein domain-containing protein n=1 Tax=Rhizophagus irregularis TaxID=588596 RepID=A0A2N1MNI3_9GLOM|nr:hypothetical protein RhiirC2_789265 [Rhizophagus irregularis]
MANAISNPYPLLELSGGVINVKEMEDFPEAYPDFLNEVPSTTLIRFPMMTGKTKGLRKHLHSLARIGLRICNYQDEQNLSVDKWDIIIVQVESLSRIEFSARLIVAILDEANAIHCQMSSGVNAQESETYHEDDIRVIDNKFQPLKSKTVDCGMARALVEKVSKLQRPDNSLVRTRAYYVNISTVEAGISFEKTDHFDVVISITNIVTPVNVEAFSAWPNDLPTAIRGHHEWNKNIISYKLDQSPAVILYLEVEHRKRLSVRNFIEISCNLIASTGASLQLIKMDDSQGVIGNRKKIRNEVRIGALVIKEADFSAVATSRNLDPEEAEILKFDQERSIADTMALKYFYMWNLYDSKDMSTKDWDDLCNKKFIEHFSPPEP